MKIVENFSDETVSDLLDKSVFLDKDKFGFTYVRDNERENLPDTTVFNSLMKLKLFRGLEIKKEWVKIYLSQEEETFYLLISDKRKGHTDISKIYGIDKNVYFEKERAIRDFLFEILNKDEFLKEKEIKNIFLQTIDKIDLDVKNIEFKSNLNYQISFITNEVFKLTFSISKTKLITYIGLSGDIKSGENLFYLNFSFDTFEEAKEKLEETILKQVSFFKEQINEAKKRDIDDLFEYNPKTAKKAYYPSMKF